MAKQSKDQKQTVERVMHEFKHHELKNSAGDPVTDRQQAIAIGLSEAGESYEKSPAENRHNRARTRLNEVAGQTGKDEAEGNRTMAELYDAAKRQDVPGRSKMSKAELQKAIS
jgi:hypothetical protein